MKTTMDTKHGLFADSDGPLKTRALNADLLRSEIQFWQGMIESLDRGKCSRESAERMHQALALAEYRLARLDEKGWPAVEPQRLRQN